MTSRKVTFAKNLTDIYFYEKDDTGDPHVWFREATRRQMQETRLLDPKSEMASIQQVLEWTDKKPISIIYGNLGRQPLFLKYYLDLCFGPDTVLHIKTEWWNKTGFLDDLEYEDDCTHCHLLLWLEPNFGATIYKPSYADRLIVLTSHLFLFGCEKIPKIAHYAGGENVYEGNTFVDEKRVHELYPYQADDFQKDIILKPQVFHTHYGSNLPLMTDLIEADEEEDYSLKEVYNICVDLSHCQTAHETYLCLLNAYDILRRIQRNRLGKWTCVIPENLQVSLALNLKMCRKYCLQNRHIPCNLDCLILLERMFLVHDTLFSIETLLEKRKEMNEKMNLKEMFLGLQLDEETDLPEEDMS